MIRSSSVHGWLRVQFKVSCDTGANTGVVTPNAVDKLQTLRLSLLNADMTLGSTLGSSLPMPLTSYKHWGRHSSMLANTTCWLAQQTPLAQTVQLARLGSKHNWLKHCHKTRQQTPLAETVQLTRLGSKHCKLAESSKELRTWNTEPITI